MSFAVVEIAGKQFLVRPGDVIETPKIVGEPGEKVSFASVLLYWDGKAVSVGKPLLKGFSVEGRIAEFGRSPKVVVYKYKRRKDSHRKTGHRQDFARVEIEKIAVSGKEAPKEEPAGEAVQPKAAARPKAAPGKKAPAKKPAVAKKKPAAKPAAKKKPAAARKPAAGGKSGTARKS